MTPHVFHVYVEICLNLRLPLTATGVDDGVSLPVPSSPDEFLPQQYASPAVVIAHTWLPAGAICVNVCPPTTR